MGVSPFALGPVVVMLPDDWDTEVQIICRGPGGERRPNLRATFRPSQDPVNLEELGRDYERSLKESFRGRVKRLPPERSAEPETRLELHFQVSVSPHEEAQHRVLLAAVPGGLVTLACSQVPGTDDPELKALFAQVMEGLKVAH